MPGAVEGRRVRRQDREAVLAFLARDPLQNLFLIDQARRLGAPPAPGELRVEMALARRAGEVVGVAALRPSVCFDAAIGSDAIEALVPYLETLGVGLLKSPVAIVDEVWRQLGRRPGRRVVVDRFETGYALRRESARLREAGPGLVARAATESDLEALVLAARESLREEDRPDPFEGDVRNFRSWVRGRVGRARVVTWNDRVVSVGYADVRLDEGWLLQGVYTWPEARERGHGSLCVSDLCREALAAGADHVQLAVVEGNLAGQLLYERLGFKPFARLRTILFTDG